MRSSLSLCLSQNKALPSSRKIRQRLVSAALSMTKGTHLEASAYEQMLLDHFVNGRLTIDQVLHYLERQAPL